MKDSNELIAEFMGVGKHYEAQSSNRFNQYHTSLNRLRPVVEEIHTHGCEIVISSNGVTTIYSDKGKVLAEEDSEADDHMLDATYKAVVTYIKEHWAILGGTAQ